MAGADQLRGSMDASQYRNVVLGLIFCSMYLALPMRSTNH